MSKCLAVIPESKIRCSAKHTADVIRNTVLDDDEIMISFDVTSNVDEEILLAEVRLSSGEMDCPPVDKDTFILLTQLDAKDVVMWTHDGYYRQVDGLAMGSQSASQLANIWLFKFEPYLFWSRFTIHPFDCDLSILINKPTMANR